MLLFVVIICDPSFLFILSMEEAFLSFLALNQIFFPVSGRSSPHNFEMFSISPLQAYSCCCWFSNNSVLTFLEGCFPSSFVAEVGIFFSILLFQWSIFYSFLRRHCDVALFTHHLELWESCSFRAYPFNRGVVSIIPLLTGVSSKGFHFANFIFYCFHFQTECFQLCSSLLFSFFHFAQPLKVHGFTRLSKKQFSLLLSSSSFSLRCHPRSRDEIFC